MSDAMKPLIFAASEGPLSRAQAEEAGSAGRFDAGIELLERSSREYQKLIRNAGILLPG